MAVTLTSINNELWGFNTGCSTLTLAAGSSTQFSPRLPQSRRWRWSIAAVSKTFSGYLCFLCIALYLKSFKRFIKLLAHKKSKVQLNRAPIYNKLCNCQKQSYYSFFRFCFLFAFKFHFQFSLILVSSVVRSLQFPKYNSVHVDEAFSVGETSHLCDFFSFLGFPYLDDWVFVCEFDNRSLKLIPWVFLP